MWHNQLNHNLSIKLITTTHYNTNTLVWSFCWARLGPVGKTAGLITPAVLGEEGKNSYFLLAGCLRQLAASPQLGFFGRTEESGGGRRGKSWETKGQAELSHALISSELHTTGDCWVRFSHLKGCGTFGVPVFCFVFKKASLITLSFRCSALVIWRQLRKIVLQMIAPWIMRWAHPVNY